MNSSYLFSGGVSVLALVIAFYSMALGTQRIPNFLLSIYKLISYALIYLFAITIFWILLEINKTYSFINIVPEVQFYLKAFMLLVAIILIGYFFLIEYHKVFSMRLYNSPLENFTCLIPKKEKNYNDENEYVEKIQIQEFCNHFIPAEEQDNLLELYEKRTSDSLSIYCEIDNRYKLDNYLIEMTCWALKQDFNILYMSCRRHPYEFMDLLKRRVEENKIKRWENCIKQILLIDAHTNHFGFKEPSYKHKTDKLIREGIHILVASWSYVGIHSAIAHGYEKKLRVGNRIGKPSLLLYDSCYALTDIENQKLYKMFMKHVVPSERCMGRNITVFIEQWVPNDIRNFTKIVVDTCIINPDNN
jgi:hypothetical protein